MATIIISIFLYRKIPCKKLIFINLKSIVNITKSVILTMLFNLLFITFGICQNFIISGKFTDSGSYKSLNLYKYNSFFDSKFIANIPIKGDSFFYYNSNIKEVDAFYIEDSQDKSKAYWFFWEGVNEFTINGNDFTKTRIKSSPLTDERDRYEKEVFEKFHSQIKNIDEQLFLLKKDFNKNKVKIDELVKNKSLKWDQGKKEQAEFEKNYILENRNSLFSLFLLTRLGIEVVDEESLQLFNNLNEKIKLHSRGLIFRK